MAVGTSEFATLWDTCHQLWDYLDVWTNCGLVQLIFWHICETKESDRRVCRRQSVGRNWVNSWKLPELCGTVAISANRYRFSRCLWKEWWVPLLVGANDDPRIATGAAKARRVSLLCRVLWVMRCYARTYNAPTNIFTVLQWEAWYNILWWDRSVLLMESN